VSRRFVSEHAGTYPVTRLCELVGVSRSTYYEWANRPLAAHYLDDVDLANAIYEIHVASRRTYGAPRVAGQLHNGGRHHGCKRVARIMGECGLVGVHGRKRWRRGKHDTAPAGDLLERDFTAERSNERWVADITEFRCRDGKLFLAGIKDLCDRCLAGWSMGERQTTDLVVNALVMALARRVPEGELLHHADHGAQYTSLEFTNRLKDWKINASYGSVGDCYDNAAMESTWATIKEGDPPHLGPVGAVHPLAAPHDPVRIHRGVLHRERHQARLGHRTPAEAYAASTAA